ncbi:MAG: hypothetical protein IKH51_10205 [Clostridia bacterium]|nr:hypothetical protein [Clostridia bacterium]
MKINFNTEALQPMSEWLINRKLCGKGDEKELRKILSGREIQVLISG